MGVACVMVLLLVSHIAYSQYGKKAEPNIQFVDSNDIGSGAYDSNAKPKTKFLDIIVENNEVGDNENNKYNFTFSDDFEIGVASAAYQYEGAWNEDGKGESIWDRMTHVAPESIIDFTNGDVACDFYHKYKEDVQRIKSLGLSTFRFSIAWARIMPTGMITSLNKKGIDFYNDLINELLKNGIKPMVTMYHWDLPQCLQDLGGWTNRIIVDYFEDYADVLFQTYGDRVQWWITINEPTKALEGYGGNVTGSGYAPNISAPGIGTYLAGHHMLLAHARVYHLYQKKYKAQQKGKISMALETYCYEPLNKKLQADHDAVKQMYEFNLGWFANPVFSKDGDYPQVMKDRIAHLSKKEGFLRSRLPEFTKEEVDYVRGTADYFGLNQYTTNHVTFKERGPIPSDMRDTGITPSAPSYWPVSTTSKWEKITPKGLRNVLKYIKDTYGSKWSIVVTENGFIDDGKLIDIQRSIYIATYMMEMWKAMYLDGVKVDGYMIWSLLDNMEWTSGYRSRSGIYYVDFNHPQRIRTPKNSTVLIKQIATTRSVPKKFTYYLKELEELEFS